MAHEDQRWRIVSYDVRDPRRYRKVFKILGGYGVSLQYSVFRCRLSDRELERLRWELAKVMDEVDRLLVINLCPSCATRITSTGHQHDWSDEACTHRILPEPPTDQAPVRVGLPEAANERTPQRTRPIRRKRAEGHP